MKTLIYSQCFLKTEEQGRFLAVNLELVQRLNPGWDILLIDNASPVKPHQFLPDSPIWDLPLLAHNEPFVFPATGSRFALAWFPDSIGHFSHKFVDERDPLTARDGPGRAHMTALRIAMNSGYDRVVFVEDDAMFMRPFEEGFAQMTKPFACLPRGRFGYLDWNCFWVNDLKWLEEFRFIEKYDWPNQKQGPGKEGERVYEWLLGDNLQVLPFIGGRGEGFVNERNLRAVWGERIDWLTHVTHATFAEALRMNGHADLADKL